MARPSSEHRTPSAPAGRRATRVVFAVVVATMTLSACSSAVKSRAAEAATRFATASPGDPAAACAMLTDDDTLFLARFADPDAG